ncbi:MAG: nucleotidyltransferase domain-containing protein [Nitrospinae bacterium]|nr:nucleotidyltransferase domain-containing protein [Nitrospinota bacterium]
MTDLSLENILNEIIKRIVSTAHPKKVILFGSAVRKEMHANSDIDLLVVIPSGRHRRKTAQNIYKNLIGLGFAADVIVVTEKDIEQFKENIGMIIKPAIEEGRVLYAA